MLITRLRWSALLLTLLSSLLPASAAVFRVANLDLTTGSPRQEAEQASLGAIAGHLRDLSPDIILIQGIRDWETCNELVRLLSPAEFRVVICSSFRQGKTQTEILDQAAILTRHNGYFSWSEPWPAATNTLIPGGFAFGAIVVGQTRLGCFSTLMPANLPRAAYEEAARTIADQVTNVKNWQNNRPSLFLIGGSMGTELADASGTGAFDLLGRAGFSSMQDGEQGALPGALLVASGNSTCSARVVGNRPFLRAWDVSVGPAAANLAGKQEASKSPPPPPKTAAPPVPLASNSVPPARALGAVQASPATATRESSAPFRPGLALFVTAALVLPALAVLLFRRRKKPETPRLLVSAPFANPNYVVLGPKSKALSADTPEPNTVVQVELEGGTHTQTWQQTIVKDEPALVRDGLMPHLRQWLKEKLVRKLVADREQLLQTQAVAADKASAVDNRLSRIERLVQEQNLAYQQQIDALTRELNATREENRELLRARIAQVKAEMASARARVLASADDSPRA